MEKLDLRLGNPEFLFPYWLDKEMPSFNDTFEKMRYQPVVGVSALHSTIRELHKKVGNADTAGKRIVIGAGITQLIAAALYACKEHGAKFAYAKPPYFFRFPDTIKTVGLEHRKEVSDSPQAEKWCEIVTSPSNPTNENYPPKFHCPMRIYDLCYNWPQYRAVFNYDLDIMLFGMSKATGHASSRIGWAVVKHDEVADLMAKFIEFTSGTPSIESQERAVYILRSQALDKEARDHDTTIFEFGRDILDSRWEELSKIKSSKFNIKNLSGMFAWVQVPNEVAVNYFDAKGILGVSGERVGVTKDFIRFNMGCSEETFQKFLHRIKTSL